jgi:apolipoprotein N-acyltransferase
MRILVLFLSGIVTALPLVIPQLAPIAWAAVTPLIYIIYKSEKPYRHGLIWSIGYYGVLYYWFIYLYPLEFAGLSNGQSVVLVMVAWIGMTMMQSLELALVPFLFKKINKSRCNVASAFLFAALWVIIEWFQTLTWTGVPWGRIAVSQYKVLPNIQISAVFGSLFLSFIIILVNAFLAIGCIKQDKKRIYAIVGLGIYIVNALFGCVSILAYSDTGEPVKVALIQGNIASGQKWAEDSVAYSMNKYMTLSQEAVDEYNPDIIVWPETVITAPIFYSHYYYDIQEFAKSTETIVAFGTYDLIYNEEIDDYDTYNAIVTFNSDGEHISQPYYKRHLVPFGEYVPMKNVIKLLVPVLGELNSYFEDDLLQGTETSVSETALGKIGYLICFDSIYETLTTDTVRDGAEIIALSTNDSWYEDSAAVHQHNGHAVLRAVESGRYIMRAANTGVSSLIRADGRILDYLDPLIEGNVYGEAYMRTARTPYSYMGNLIVWLSIGYVGYEGVTRFFEKKLCKKLQY